MRDFQHHCEITPTLKVSASIHFDTAGEPYVHSIDIGRTTIIDGYLFRALSPLIIDTLEAEDLAEAA